MAEVIGLIASVTSLIAFASETSKACHKLAETIISFKNAPTDIQKVGVELLDLAQILELIESVLQQLQDGKLDLQGHLEVVQRRVSRIKTGIKEIADVLVAVQPTASGSSTKSRAKWIYKKSEIASMIAIIDREKHGLLLQFDLLNAKFAHTTLADLRDFREDLKQVVPRTEDLAASITTSISESNSRLKNVVQASATSLQSSIRDEIHQTVLSIPRESNISQTSLQTLSVLVSNIVASRSQSLESQTSLEHPGRRSCNQIESLRRPPDKPQTEDVGTMTSVSHAMVDDSCNEDSGHFDRKEESSRLISRTSVQAMTSMFGKVVIRRSTVKIVYSNSDSELFSEEAKMEIDFLPASWLRYWTGCGIFLARMGFGKPTVDINTTVARILDFKSDLNRLEALRAIREGDIRRVIGFLQSKLVYPTDRDLYGRSLLSVSGTVPINLNIAAKAGQLETCELLLQQGAGVGINTPEFFWPTYPIADAIRSSTKRNDHDLVRLFLKYGADITIEQTSVMPSFTMLPLVYGCAETHETKSLFQFLVDNDPEFDINQSAGSLHLTPILLAESQPLQIYEHLIELGADVKALAPFDHTVLHYFFKNMFFRVDFPCSVDTFLDGGEILALLIQAGADPLAANGLGELPQDVGSKWSTFPLRKVEERIFLAFWHQALLICGLYGPKYCHCPAHHWQKIARHYVGPNFPLRRQGFGILPFYDTFEEEMSAALRGWDKIAAQETPPSSANGMTSEKQDKWNQRCDELDKWVQEVLIELQARQRKASSARHTGNKGFRSDEMQSSDHSTMKGSPFLTQGSDSDEYWRTSSGSSSNGEEEWESAPEI